MPADCVAKASGEVPLAVAVNEHFETSRLNVTVEVVGTRFDVSWDASARVLELRLDEGAVMVSGGLLGDALTVILDDVLW